MWTGNDDKSDTYFTVFIIIIIIILFAQSKTVALSNLIYYCTI